MDEKRVITESEYFEVKLSDFVRSSHRKYKQIRDSILTFFPEREMLVMASPMGSIKKPADQTQLNQAFQDDMIVLRQKVFNETSQKKI